MSTPKFYDRCCNPVNELSHGSKVHKKNLRSASDIIGEKIDTIKSTDKLCHPCRIKIGKMTAHELSKFFRTFLKIAHFVYCFSKMTIFFRCFV